MWLKRSLKRGGDDPADLENGPSPHNKAQRKLSRRHTPINAEHSTLDPASFLDGTFVKAFASTCVSKAIVKAGRPLYEATLDIGSGCTGSAMDKVALHSVDKALAEENVRIRLKTPYICEADRNKLQWAQKVHRLLDGGTPCAYENLASFDPDLGREVECVVEGHGCTMKVCQDGLICGISCKPHSKSNTNRKTIEGIGETFQGLLSLVDRIPCDWLIIENVEEFASEENREIKEGWSLLTLALTDRNYDIQGFTLAAQDYGLPQKRIRLYGVGIRRPGRRVEVQSAQEFFDLVQELLQDFKMKGPSLPDLLLDQDDPAVAHELEKRQSRTSKGWDSGTIQAHRLAWAQAGGRWLATPPRKNDVTTPWYDTLPAREKDKLAFHHWKYREEARDRALGTDVGLSIVRETWLTVEESGRVLAPTVCPKSKLWVSFSKESGVERHGLLLGMELMQLQGFPIYCPSLKALVAKEQEDNGAFLSDLAGNAFPSTVIVALVVAILFALEFKPDSDATLASTSEDVQAALRLIKRGRRTAEG